MYVFSLEYFSSLLSNGTYTKVPWFPFSELYPNGAGYFHIFVLLFRDVARYLNVYLYVKIFCNEYDQGLGGHKGNNCAQIYVVYPYLGCYY